MILGLADLGPFPAPGDDLSLELGLSAWLYRSGSSLDQAIDEMFEVRALVLEVAEMDAATEPVPFVGRSSELDLVTMAVYLDSLLARAAHSAELSRSSLARQVALRLVPTSVVASLAC
jgi:hypothetical protein